MMSINSKLRENAREQLEGKWGKPVLFGFLFMLISALPSIIPLIGKNHQFISSALQIIISLLITGSLTVGAIMFSLRFKRGEAPGVAVLFEGFQHFGATLGLYLWYLLWVLLWTLLLIIPGIIKGIAYSMCFYVMADNPKIGIKNALNISKKITKGYKGKIFVFNLSFVGWSILAMLPLGIGYLWLIPYMQISTANLYDQIKRESIEKFVCTEEEYLKTS
ncbi:MAG TPA: DUF975 family protein [Desulfosporosinus sp.]